MAKLGSQSCHTRRIYWLRQAKKKFFRICAKCADSDHPAHAQSIMWAFAINSIILWHPIIVKADSEGTDQTARMRRMI